MTRADHETDGPATPLARPKAPIPTPFYYGWLILAVTVVSAGLSGTTSQLFTSIMVNPLTDEMGWTRTQMAGALTIGVFATAALSPILGRLTDQHGPRAIMSVGAVVVAAGFVAVANMRTLWQWYVSYVIARGVAQAALSGVVSSTTITNWFIRKRGRALGIMSSSFQLSSTFLIPLAQFVILRWGWRIVYMLLGAATAVMVLIPAAVFLRKRPEDIGLLPDGAQPAAAPATESGPPRAAGTQSTEINFTAKEAMATRTFWWLVGAQFVTLLVTGSVTFHLVAYFTDIGVSPGARAFAASLFAFASGFSNTMWGYLAERFSERLLGIAATLLGGASMVLIILLRGDLAALLLTVFYGATARGQGAVLQLLIAQYYGRASFGAVSGTLLPIGYIGLGIGPLIGSVVYDLTGTYVAFLVTLVGLHVLSALFLLAAVRPRLPERLRTATAR